VFIFKINDKFTKDFIIKLDNIKKNKKVLCIRSLHSLKSKFLRAIYWQFLQPQVVSLPLLRTEPVLRGWGPARER